MIFRIEIKEKTSEEYTHGEWAWDALPFGDIGVNI
jgi:hypothetical protein